MTSKHSRCAQLDVCQGLGADQCPDCDSFDCEVACSAEPARPTYPFAPGVIQGPKADSFAHLGDETDFDLISTRDLRVILILIVVCFIIAGLVARWFS